MKLKSELYIQELFILLHGLNLQVVECTEILKKEKRKAQIASIFAPWASQTIWMSLAVKADALMQHVSSLQELREKIMLAEGSDKNMEPITFEQICEKEMQ